MFIKIKNSIINIEKINSIIKTEYGYKICFSDSEKFIINEFEYKDLLEELNLYNTTKYNHIIKELS